MKAGVDLNLPPKIIIDTIHQVKVVKQIMLSWRANAIFHRIMTKRI